LLHEDDRYPDGLGDVAFGPAESSKGALGGVVLEILVGKEVRLFHSLQKHSGVEEKKTVTRVDYPGWQIVVLKKGMVRSWTSRSGTLRLMEDFSARTAEQNSYLWASPRSTARSGIVPVRSS
jgi:hypothetical protein